MKLRRSLSLKLIGLFLLIGLLLSSLIKFSFQYGFRNQWREFAEPHLTEYVSHILNEIGDPPDESRIAALRSRLPIDIYVQGHGYAWPPDAMPPSIGGGRVHAHLLSDGREVQVSREHGRFSVTIPLSDTRLIIVPRGFDPAESAPLATLLTIAAALFILFLAYYLIRRMFRPVSTLRESLARFGEGELDQRIVLKRKDELGELANSFNSMADEIQAMLEAKRQLLLAISHELRSPLTRAKVHLALMDDSGEHKAVERNLNEIQSLIEELLETERLNDRHNSLNRESVDPDMLVREVMDATENGENVYIRLQGAGQKLELDPARIRLLIRNLLENALRHTPADSEPPELISELRGGAWRLIVRDNGQGIEPEHLAHITEPFYRADPSRRRETGGYGLGLYLCRVIAEAHGGELNVTSQVGQGTSVDVSLPIDAGFPGKPEK